MKHALLYLSVLASLGTNAQQPDDLLVHGIGSQAHLMGSAAVHATVLLDEEPPVEEETLELVSFEASSNGTEGVLVRWTVLHERSGDLYRVERSNDLITWYPATQLVVNTVRNGYTAHSAIDRAPFSGVSYYRLMHVDGKGEHEVSDLFSVRHDLGHDLVIHDGHAPGHFVVLASGRIEEVQLLNNRGQFVAMELDPEGERVRVNAALLEPGTYYVQAVVNGKRTMRPVIIGPHGAVGG